MARPCIHGDVCRAYMREKRCILRGRCPMCEYYEPVDWSVGAKPYASEKSTCAVSYWPRWPKEG